MSYRDRDFERGRGRGMEWTGQGNGYRGQSSRQDQFGGQGGYGWGDEGPGQYGNEGFRGQERFGGGYGQGGYGQESGRQAADWQGSQYGGNESFGQGMGWAQGRMRDRGYGDEGQFGGGHGQGAGDYMSPYGRGGETYARGDIGRAGGWQPNAEQGWGTQGRTRGGSWDQSQSWEQGPSGPGNWGQGYSDQGMIDQGQQARQRFGGQGRPGGGGGTFYYEEVWLIPGPHSGRGPRGYQRNDQRIEEDVCERLTHHGQIDAEDIQVQVKNGEVTLTGTVESRQAKRMAEDLLDSVSGVKDVHNQLRVQQGRDQAQSRSDQDQLIGQTQMGGGQGGSTARGGQSRNQSRRNETAQAGAGGS